MASHGDSSFRRWALWLGHRLYAGRWWLVAALATAGIVLLFVYHQTKQAALLIGAFGPFGWPVAAVVLGVLFRDPIGALILRVETINITLPGGGKLILTTHEVEAVREVARDQRIADQHIAEDAEDAFARILEEAVRD